MVTEQFADEAEDTFPTLITRLSEAEAKDFWDNRSRKHMPENRHDLQLLQSYDVELSLREKLGQDTTALKEKIAKVIDPLDLTESGIKKDPQKFYDDAKTHFGFVVKPDQTRKPNSERP